MIKLSDSQIAYLGSTKSERIVAWNASPLWLRGEFMAAEIAKDNARDEAAIEAEERYQAKIAAQVIEPLTRDELVKDVREHPAMAKRHGNTAALVEMDHAEALRIAFVGGPEPDGSCAKCVQISHPFSDASSPDIAPDRPKNMRIANLRVDVVHARSFVPDAVETPYAALCSAWAARGDVVELTTDEVNCTKCLLALSAD